MPTKRGAELVASRRFNGPFIISGRAYLQGPVVPTISGSGFPLSICHRIVFLNSSLPIGTDIFHLDSAQVHGMCT